MTDANQAYIEALKADGAKLVLKIDHAAIQHAVYSVQKPSRREALAMAQLAHAKASQKAKAEYKVILEATLPCGSKIVATGDGVGARKIELHADRDAVTANEYDHAYDVFKEAGEFLKALSKFKRHATEFKLSI